ncbi:hypothetical protein B566_EDAN009277 [Ephemera danica]|nr:hypothetical protein B566_EDAN009277 [Ephemera danica]
MESLENRTPIVVLAMMPSPPKLPSTTSKKNPVSVSGCSSATVTSSKDVAEPSHDSATADEWCRARKRTKFSGLLRDGAKTSHPKKYKESNESSESSNSDSSENTTSESEDEPDEPKKVLPKVVKITTTKSKYRGRYQKFVLSDSDEDESKMSAAQLQRKRNIEARQEFLKKLDMEETKRELEECFKKPKKERKPQEVKPKEPLALRPKSLRIQNTQIPATRAKRQVVSPSYPVLQMNEITQGKFTSEDCTDFFVTLYSKLYDMTKLKTEMDLKTCTLEEFQTKTSNLTLRNEQSSGVLPDLVSSFALHPSSNVMLLGAGGKSGSVGFWNIDLENEDWKDMDVIVFLPHVDNVSALTFSKYDVDSVFSCSFDGTVRRGDLIKQMFQLLYAEDNISPLHCITEHSKSQLYASKQGGNIVSIDTRIPYNKQNIYRTFHYGIIHTLNVNPRNRDQLLSCSEDKWLALWDLRMLGTRRSNSPLWQLNTEFPVSSAFFSGSGSHILSTHSNAELVCIYEIQRRVVPLKAWEDVFCVPNNKEGLDVYCCDYTTEPLHSIHEPLHLPMKRCTHAIFHPTLPAMVASYRYRLHLFL